MVGITNNPVRHFGEGGAGAADEVAAPLTVPMPKPTFGAEVVLAKLGAVEAPMLSPTSFDSLLEDGDVKAFVNSLDTSVYLNLNELIKASSLPVSVVRDIALMARDGDLYHPKVMPKSIAELAVRGLSGLGVSFGDDAIVSDIVWSVMKRNPEFMMWYDLGGAAGLANATITAAAYGMTLGSWKSVILDSTMATPEVPGR